MKKNIILFFISIYCISLYSHSDMIMSYTFGNVNMKVQFGFNQEERNKAQIIAQQADMFLKDIGYKKKVNIFFDHNYINDISPVYWLSYGKNPYLFNKSKNGICIYVKSKTFNTSEILRLLEYGINNIEDIKKNQEEKEKELNGGVYNDKIKRFEKRYMKYTSISDDLINKIISSQTFPSISKIMNKRFYRPSENNYSISYYHTE